MSRRMPIAPMMLPSVSRRADAFSVVGIISPDALRGCRRTLRVTSRSTTSRRAATNSRAWSCERKREMDCSSTSSRRRPRRRETASFASRILPSRSQTKTGSGAFAMMMSAASGGLTVRSAAEDRTSGMPPIVQTGGSAVHQVVTLNAHRVGRLDLSSERRAQIFERRLLLVTDTHAADTEEASFLRRVGYLLTDRDEPPLERLRLLGLALVLHDCRCLPARVERGAAQLIRGLGLELGGHALLAGLRCFQICHERLHEGARGSMELDVGQRLADREHLLDDPKRPARAGGDDHQPR